MLGKAEHVAYHVQTRLQNSGVNEPKFTKFLSDIKQLSMVLMHASMLRTSDPSYYFNKYVCLWRLTYIHTCRAYVYTPCEFDSHVSHKSLEASHTARLNVPRHALESPTGTFIVHTLADLSDFGLLGEQSSQKWEIPCLGRR